MTEDQIKYEVMNLQSNSSCVPLLKLKKGAVVMCLINLDMENGICNGSQGVVIDILPGISPVPVVKFTNGLTRQIHPHYWQSDEYPTIAIGQIPLCLAWAITIHKIQGATLSLAEMDLGNSIFEYGQTYVALSRIQSLDGLYLSSFHPQRIKANPKVVAFYRAMPILDYTIPVTKPIIEEKMVEPVLLLPPSNVKIIKL
jgi:ATP-dependent DNA helicase PIF1